jgi:hypothetical protein
LPATAILDEPLPELSEEGPITVEIIADSINPDHLAFVIRNPTSKLLDEDTWNVPWEPDYTEHEPIHWASLSDPEEMFEIHWAEV